MLFGPIIQLIFLYWGVGGNPNGLRLGIIDREIKAFDDCMNSSLTSVLRHNDTCDLRQVSCLFLEQLTDEIAIKVFYDSYEEAFLDAKRGKIIGFIEFPLTFSDSMAETLQPNYNQSSRPNDTISITMDQTNHQLTVFMQKNLYDAYKNFTEKISTSCGLSPKLHTFPMNFLEPIYGSYNDNSRNSMARPFIIGMTFFVILAQTIVVIMADRKEGFWNRTLLAGVTTSEILLAHVIIQSVLLIWQVIEVVLLVAWIFTFEHRGSYCLTILMLALQGWAGLFLGLLLSCLCTSFTMACFVGAGITQPLTSLSGMMWPIEGMQTVLRYFSYATPFALPSVAVSDIMIKGYGFTDPSVFTGFGVVLAWIIIGAILCVKVLQRNKFSQNN